MRVIPKLGAEEIPRELPNTGDDTLKNQMKMVLSALQKHILAISRVKLEPKGETELNSRRTFVTCYFCDKEREVRDILRVPHGESGKVVDVKVFTRER